MTNTAAGTDSRTASPPGSTTPLPKIISVDDPNAITMLGLDRT